MSPDDAVVSFQKLGCTRIPRHGRKNYVWLERSDESGHQIAIFNVPTSKNPVRTGTLRAILQANGIRDEEHLKELLADPDPPGAFARILPRGGVRYRPRGQPQ